MASRTVGIGVLVIGLIILASGIYFWVAMPGQNSTSLLSTTQYQVKKGDEISIGIPLTAGNTIKGTFAQINGTTVNFYLMNSVQQNAFGNCVPCSSPSIFNASNPSTYSYAITINSTGTYYVVLDNSNGNSAVAVTATVNMATSSGISTIYYSLVGLGVVLVIAGAAIAATSGRKKVGEKKEKTEVTTPPSSPAGVATQ